MTIHTNTIHKQFLELCSQIYRHMVPDICRRAYGHRSLSYSTTLLFMKHIATAEKLTAAWKNVDEDLEQGIRTPATLLAFAKYSRAYIGILMQAQISRHMRLATEILEIMPTDIVEVVT